MANFYAILKLSVGDYVLRRQVLDTSPSKFAFSFGISIFRKEAALRVLFFSRVITGAVK